MKDSTAAASARALFCIVVLISNAAGFSKAVGATVDVSPEAKRAAVEIRREAMLSPQGPAGRPLPLVSHWNMGSHGKG